MDFLTLDLTANYFDLRIAQHFEFYISTKVLVVILGIVVVLRTRKLLVDRIAQRKVVPFTPPKVWNSDNPFDDFA